MPATAQDLVDAALAAGSATSPAARPTLRVQVVLYLHHPGTARRVASSLAASVRVAKESGLLGAVEIRFGDSSPTGFTAEEVEELERYAVEAGFDRASYELFGANLGSAGGSNRLAEGADTDFLLVLNPDTYASPTFLGNLIEAAREPAVGAIDARQIPLEHPKAYDLKTGDTSWASGACMLVRTPAFREVGGFDDEYFFLHCDDVDLSWRLRLVGWRVRHEPSAVVFHDKRPAAHGSIEPTDTEVYHSLRGRLLLTRRYARPDLEQETIDFVERHGNDQQQRAVADFLEQAEADKVPEPISDAYRVAEFIDGEYAEHRF
jgi:GT2 family glycosyltransferase